MAMSQRTPSHCPAIFDQLADHRFLRGRVAVVELQGVGPAGEVGIAPVGQEQIAALALDPGVVLRRSGQVELRPGDEILGVVFDPGVIEPRVVGDEIEHQPQAALAEPLAQAGQRGVAAEILVHRVAGDREPGAGDVFLAQVRQRLLEFACATRHCCANLLAGRAGLPDAEEPDPVETHLGQAIQLGVGNVIQRRGPAQLPGQLGQPDARVDLIERGIADWLLMVLTIASRSSQLACSPELPTSCRRQRLARTDGCACGLSLASRNTAFLPPSRTCFRRDGRKQMHQRGR